MYEYELERYLNVRAAGSASFGPDGRVAFQTNATGTSQVWTLEEPGTWPEQQTFYDQSVGFFSWSPERPEFIFGMDDNGNERDQFFRLTLEDGLIVPLTATPEAKHGWGGWAHDGDRFAFTSNRRQEDVFDIYVQKRDECGDDATLIAETDGMYYVTGWGPNDERLVVAQTQSKSDHDLYILDINSGDMTRVTPQKGENRFMSPQIGPEGDALYCVTDYGSDTLRFVRLALGGGSFEKRLSIVADDGEWNIDGVVLDDETGRLVYTRNVNGYTDLTVGELDGPTDLREFPTPKLPGGTAGGISWGPNGERFVLTVSGRSQNTNVFVVDAETGDSERWTCASTAGIPESTFLEPDSVHYETFDGREIPAFFTLPHEHAADETPVIVDIHGGPESQHRPSFSGLKQYFLSRGYALFEPNIRGSTGYGNAYTCLDDVEKRMDSVKDVRAGVDWLCGHDAIDSDRIAIMGGSYGGFVVLAALTEYPELWAAGVDMFGIANFVTFLQNTGEWRRKHREAEYGSLEGNRGFLESISPINNIEAIDSPLFVLHGTNDPRVPVKEAEQVADRANEQGVPVEKLIFEDEGHGISKLENRIEAYTAIVDFLDEHV